MQAARIAELLAPFLDAPSANDQRPTTNDALIHNISTYIDILQRWNARINLTAIRDEEEIVTRHFAESLFAARHLFPSTSHVGTAALGRPSSEARRSSDAEGPRIRVADLGSGAGFPGIPIKLWAPQISLTLIESNQKKSTFLREVARALTLTDVDIHAGRAETLLTAGQPRASFDVVTLRAVEHFEQALPIAARLLAPGGSLALLVGAGQQQAAHSAITDVTWKEPIPIPKSSNRILLIAKV